MATLTHAWRDNLAVDALVIRSDAPPEWAPRNTVHIPLSGPPLVSSMPGLTRTGTLTVWAPDTASRDRVLALAHYGDPVHLGDVCDDELLDDMWLAITRVAAERPAVDRPGMWLALEYTRTAPPAGDPPPIWVYADVLAAHPTYADAAAAYPTYDALWLGPAGLATEPDPASAGWGW